MDTIELFFTLHVLSGTILSSTEQVRYHKISFNYIVFLCFSPLPVETIVPTLEITMKHPRPSHLLLTLVLGVVLCPTVAAAQSVSFTGGVGIGSGVTMGRAKTHQTSKQSPGFVTLDLLLHFDEETTVKYGVELVAEVESRSTFGLLPKVELNLKLHPTIALTTYLGAHGKLAPQTLFGVEFGLMPTLFFNRIALYLRVGVGIFFAGGDLPEENAITKIDFTLGVRTPLFTYGE